MNLSFLFVNVVWGEEFTELFIKVALPNQISGRNLGTDFISKTNAIYDLYTTKNDFEKISESRHFKLLNQELKVDVTFIDDFIDDSVPVHGTLSECHQRAIRKGSEQDSAIVFLCPDIICSDGTIEALVKLAMADKKIVLTAGPRLSKEEVVPIILDRYKPESNNSITISSRELALFGTKFPHQITKTSYWNAKPFTTHPSVLYWNVGDEGFLTRCFHLHPVMVRLQNDFKNFNSTIDGDFIRENISSKDDVYIITDSDELLIFEMSPRNHQFPTIGKADLFNIVPWALWATDSLHRSYIKQGIKIHSKDLSEEWQNVERETDKIVEKILSLMSHKKTFLVFSWINIFYKRIVVATLFYISASAYFLMLIIKTGNRWLRLCTKKTFSSIRSLFNISKKMLRYVFHRKIKTQHFIPSPQDSITGTLITKATNAAGQGNYGHSFFYCSAAMFLLQDEKIPIVKRFKTALAVGFEEQVKRDLASIKKAINEVT